MDFIYSFIGQDEKFNIASISAKILKDDIVDYDVIKFDYEESNLPALLETLNTSSFFAVGKIIILYNASFLYEDVKDMISANNFIKYLTSNNLTNYLYISIRDLNEVNSFYKETILKNSIIVKNDILKPEEFFTYSKDLLTKSGYTISDEDINEIVNRSESDYMLLNSNLNKMMIYAYESKKISRTDINQLITRNIDDTVYDLVDAYLSQNKNKCFDILTNLRKNKVDDTLILGSLIGKIKEMAITKRLVNDKQTKDQIAQLLNVKEGRAYYMIKNVIDYDYDALNKKLNKLLELDYLSKLGKMDLSLFLLAYLIS